MTKPPVKMTPFPMGNIVKTPSIHNDIIKTCHVYLPAREALVSMAREDDETVDESASCEEGPMEGQAAGPRYTDHRHAMHCIHCSAMSIVS